MPPQIRAAGNCGSDHLEKDKGMSEGWIAFGIAAAIIVALGIGFLVVMWGFTFRG